MVVVGHDGTARGSRKTLFVGVGGSGVETVTYVKAHQVARSGHVLPSTAFVGLDVLDGPPLVTVPAEEDGTPIPVALVPGREYLAIGKDCDPRHLSEILRGSRSLRPTLRSLLDRQPGGRFLKSLDAGTEGERSYGYLAYLWSETEVEDMVAASLRLLNDLRLAHEPGAVATDSPINVVVTGSEAGGVGSAIALPVCGLIKRTMARLGMSVHRSLFTYVSFGPEAFPETTLRLHNAFEALSDLAIAQREGITP